MKRWFFIAGAIAAACLMNASLHAETPASTAKQEAKTMRARGPFDVKIQPLPADKDADPALGRMSLDKQLHGDLEGTSKGVMMTADSSRKDSGSYLAFEKVTGTLHGRSGTFILQHHGVMDRGAPHLNISVVPDSGTGQLTGLTGKMNIIIAADGKHSYDFEYTLE